MPTTDGRHERDGEVPRWAATAGQHRFRAPRWASRLFCSRRRRTDDSEPEVVASVLPWSVRTDEITQCELFRRRVLRSGTGTWLGRLAMTTSVMSGILSRALRVVPCSCTEPDSS
jgi:hypothetical protein